MMAQVARQATGERPMPAMNGREVILSFPACEHRKPYGVILYRCGRSGFYQLILTDRRRLNFNNPLPHGGDADYLCLRNQCLARFIARNLHGAYNPKQALARMRDQIRKAGEDAYVKRCYQ